MSQANVPIVACGEQRSPSREWQSAFIREWYRLAEGCADLEQTADAALELYTAHGARNPEEFAREEWGTPA
ncbi:hypothetical protein [Variovorax guangxiensis]|uniref:hypothetical protein n=1 Tax=Variovorax guangxiensis TaxID=1775474 RepID=UPI00285BFA67|nr:hypothetical protein [Variovorax guangxiensis]MDR6859955.1 hypothetical protein [Variovorax guangxiensis]